MAKQARAELPINLAHTYSEHLINVLVMGNNSISYVFDLGKCPMLIDLIREINHHKAHTIWR